MMQTRDMHYLAHLDLIFDDLAEEAEHRLLTDRLHGGTEGGIGGITNLGIRIASVLKCHFIVDKK